MSPAATAAEAGNALCGMRPYHLNRPLKSLGFSFVRNLTDETAAPMTIDHWRFSHSGRYGSRRHRLCCCCCLEFELMRVLANGVCLYLSEGISFMSWTDRRTRVSLRFSSFSQFLCVSDESFLREHCGNKRNRVL